jgi:SLOG in TRPM, prokaryote
MIEPFEIALRQDSPATAVRVERPEQLEEAPTALGLTGVRASLVLIGGADGMSRGDHERLEPLFTGVLAELASELGAAVLDGGTDTGVMRLMGRARAHTAGDFPLVGVLPSALAAHPAEPVRPGTAELEPNHTHFVLVPGDEWGEEGPWLARLGDMVGDGSVTVLVNGGEISLRDAELCVTAGRPLVVVAGSGRTADRIAAAAAGRPPDEASARIARTGLVRPVDVGDRAALAAALDLVLTGGN